MSNPTHAITIREPWIWAILAAGKRIENRTWSTKFRGPIYLHASVNVASKAAQRELLDKLQRAGSSLDALGSVMVDVDRRERQRKRIPLPYVRDLPRGALVATADLVDCTTAVPPGQELWADAGAVYFVLANVTPLAAPIPMSSLGIWRVSGRPRRRAAEPSRFAGACG